MRRRDFLGIVMGGLASVPSVSPMQAQTLPETVSLKSVDGTALTGYFFKPSPAPSRRSPAMVLLHGRAGPYSTAANGRYDATTLSQRHLFWARYWADRGVFALLVDSFGPRGFPAGFGRFSHADRPAQVSEVTVRPLDAYGGLKFLAGHKDVDPERIGLHGWSNGGSTTLVAMSSHTLRTVGLGVAQAFRAGLAFYPACGLDDRFTTGLAVYAPTLVLMGAADEEVSPKRCRQLVDSSRRGGDDISLTVYAGATHDFDDPGRRRQGIEANAAALREAIEASQMFMARHLRIEI